jgi:hypothetical protein
VRLKLGLSHEGSKNGLKVPENTAVSKKIDTTEEEERREWRNLHNEEIHDFYSLLHYIRMMKSWRMR